MIPSFARILAAYEFALSNMTIVARGMRGGQ
jgi:hypothetical protein